jgi:sulfatase maturation enzyme AslB (radical SAM superfamily)
MFSKKGDPACHKCLLHEKVEGQSHRILWNDRNLTNWSDVGTEPSLKGLDLDMGNLCNLKCVTCNSHNSTTWISDEKSLGGNIHCASPKRFDISTLNPEIFQHLEWLKLAGGEVLLMSEHTELLNYLIKNKFSENIELIYIVNNTVPPEAFFEKWSHFKNVRIVLSVDGVDTVNEYIRFPSRWQDNLSVIQQFLSSSCQVEVNSVVSLYNILHLDQLLSWWRSIAGQRKIFFRILNAPDFMSIEHLPPELTAKAMKQLRGIDELQHIYHFLKNKEDFQSPKFQQFLGYTESLDRLRKTNLYRINPDYESIQRNP